MSLLKGHFDLELKSELGSKLYCIFRDNFTELLYYETRERKSEINPYKKRETQNERNKSVKQKKMVKMNKKKPAKQLSTAHVGMSGVVSAWRHGKTKDG